MVAASVREREKIDRERERERENENGLLDLVAPGVFFPQQSPLVGFFARI